MNLSIFVGREDSAEPTWGQYFANASLFVPRNESFCKFKINNDQLWGTGLCGHEALAGFMAVLHLG